ncbi:MAG: TldD/PmbA family protein [Spirochaetes bacterium]|nr:TldD/PmbA family protein [Spirochaetota bacterium]
MTAGNPMREGLDRAISRARALLSVCPCEFAEIRLSASTGTSISLSGEQVETFSSGDTVGGSVRVLNNGAWGFISFNDLSDIERHFRQGIAISSSLGLTEKTRIRRANAVRKHFATTMGKNFTRIPLDEKFRLISGYNGILRSSSKIQTTRAVYRDVISEYAYLNSEGSEITYDRAYCGVQLSSVARDGSVIQPYGESVSGYGGYEIAEGRDDLADAVVKIAVDLLSAEPVPGGTYRVVADQKLAGVFIHEAFGHLSEADFVHENERLREVMVFGKEFGPPELSVVDCGDMPELSGYIPFDDEGVLPCETRLITNGLLSGRLHSRETAEKMGEETTGNARAIGVMNQPIVRMTNTYIENGDHSRETILDAAGDGVYAAGMIGGETNLEMFTFTSAYGYEIRNGKPGKMYKDIVLTGNVFTTLRNIDMIGNDRRMFGGLGGCGKGGQGPLPVSFGGPHLLIKDVLIGGAQ